MRLGVMSDIHCNGSAMTRALGELEGQVDASLVAGDAVLQYRFSDEVIAAVRAHRMHYVVGNHELALLANASRALADDRADPGNVAFMAQAGARVDLGVCGKHLVMVHASPFPPFSDYLYEGSRALARCAALDADILVVGHTHVPMAKRVGDVLVVNPGSLGQASDPDHPGMVSYAILDAEAEAVTVHRFPDPQLA